MSLRRGLVLILLLAYGATAGAEESALPQLGEHTFIPVMALTEPFITTHVQTNISLGSTVNSTVPVIDVVNEEIIGTAKANLALAGIGFHYQYAAKEWLAVYIGLVTAGRLGTSTTSLLAEGITASVGYNLGWQMRIYHSQKFILSGSVSLGNQNATFVNLIDWVDGILEGTNVPLVRARQSLRSNGGFHAGWGISRRFGLLGSFRLNYGESFDGKGVNDWKSDGRLALSYDMAYDIKVPLGLALTGGYYQDDNLGEAKNDIWFWSLRLAALGRRDFSISLDLMTSYFDSFEQGTAQQFTQLGIALRYFY
jgi:hypothetical protein